MRIVMVVNNDRGQLFSLLGCFEKEAVKSHASCSGTSGLAFGCACRPPLPAQNCNSPYNINPSLHLINILPQPSVVDCATDSRHFRRNFEYPPAVWNQEEWCRARAQLEYFGQARVGVRSEAASSRYQQHRGRYLKSPSKSDQPSRLGYCEHGKP